VTFGLPPPEAKGTTSSDYRQVKPENFEPSESSEKADQADIPNLRALGIHSCDLRYLCDLRISVVSFSVESKPGRKSLSRQQDRRDD